MVGPMSVEYMEHEISNNGGTKVICNDSNNIKVLYNQYSEE